MPVRSTALREPRVALLVETSLASGRDILRGIARHVRESGPWSLFHAPHGLGESLQTWLRTWQGDGIIARIANPRTARLVRAAGVPAVDVLGMVPNAGFPLVHVDDAAIARAAFAHFAARGFRHFAAFGLPPEPWAAGQPDWSARRCAAFLALASEAGASADAFAFQRSELTGPREKRQDRLAAWLRRLPRPVGLLVCSDQHGLDVLDACRRAALHVPDEIAVAGVDNDEPLCEVCSPPLTSVWPDHEGVGQRAAALLDSLMRGAKPPPEPLSVPPLRVVTRRSSDVLAVDDAAVAAALRIIRDHACAGISVDEIVRASGTSRSVLQRRFRALLGETIHDHLVGARLKRARELISATSLPLPEIAERCGFHHQEYMGKVFRDRLGCTPGSLRTTRKRPR